MKTLLGSAEFVEESKNRVGEIPRGARLQRSGGGRREEGALLCSSPHNGFDVTIEVKAGE